MQNSEKKQHYPLLDHPDSYATSDAATAVFVVFLLLLADGFIRTG